jgi:Zn-finger nucleic acid-binding protein
LSFAIDQCGHCNSFWLDAGEWAALRAQGLHTQLHQVTGAAWQRKLGQEQHQQVRDTFYTEQLGTTDYAEARRVRAWLQRHRARDLLLAYLGHDDSALD